MLTAVQYKSVIAILSPLVLLFAIADTCRRIVMGTQRLATVLQLRLWTLNQGSISCRK